MPTIEQARQWYIDADPVHDFAHVLRVYHLAERLAEAEGADLEIVRAAVLLHDVQGSTSGGAKRSQHHIASAEFAYQELTAEGWPQARIEGVQHCILAHRFRATERPQSIEAQVVFDADKLDAIGAIGAARAIAYATQARQPFFVQPSDQFMQTGEKEPGEPHSAYHEFVFKLSRLSDRLFTPSARQLAEGRHRYLRDFFQQLGAEIQGLR